MSRFDPLKRQFDERRRVIQHKAEEASQRVSEGSEIVRSWQHPYEQLRDEVIPMLKRGLLQLKTTEVQPPASESLKQEVEQWEMLPDDSRVKQVDSGNGQLWRKVQGLRARRGFKNLGRFITGDDGGTSHQDDDREGR